MNHWLQLFIEQIKETTWLQWLAVALGVTEVLLARVNNIWLYPAGILGTAIYIYLLMDVHLYAESVLNGYYVVMSVYGWILWAKKDTQQHHIINIEFSNAKQWLQQLLFFTFFYVVIFFILTYVKKSFAPGAIPWADAFASATAYTGMWLMAKKKVESWYWWIATNIASIPLYFVKDYVFTSVYYFILLIMAFFGLAEWMRRGRAGQQSTVNGS